MIETSQNQMEFKIAKIVDEYTVVINGGRQSGIKENDCFEIYDKGSEVKDPDTGKSLGFLNHIKANIVVTKVYDKMAVCQNVDSISGIMPGFPDNLFLRQSKLNVTSSEISGGMDRKIHVGDLLRKLPETNTKTNQESD